jgi:DNA-binding HxlR family transcriptional regulator
MSDRTYNQYCGLAYALDRVGERWTILIIRELIAGPRRYKDLVDGLPGISTNLLASRLKSLEQDGVIQRRVLPPPAGSTVYELTPLGQGLELALLELGKWGSQFVPLVELVDGLQRRQRVDVQLPTRPETGWSRGRGRSAGRC